METFEITSYEQLAGKFGRNETRILLGFLNYRTRTEVERRMNIFLVKQDKVELIEKISDTRSELNDKIDSTRKELNEKIERTRNELIGMITDVRNELTEKINDVEKRLTQKINDLRNELLEKIHQSQQLLIRWMVILWFSAVALIVGILKFL